MTDLRGYHLGSGEGKAWWFLDTLMTVKAGGDDTHDSFTLIEFGAPIGFGPPLHIHHREDEAFYRSTARCKWCVARIGGRPARVP